MDGNTGSYRPELAHHLIVLDCSKAMIKDKL